MAKLSKASGRIMNCMKGGVLSPIALSGLLLLARGGMAEEGLVEEGLVEEALGEGTLGMPCRNIVKKLETETGGKFTGPTPQSDGRVTYHAERTRHGYYADAFYSCSNAKSVVVSMSLYMQIMSEQDRAQVARMEVESAKRAGYSVCREFHEIGQEPPQKGVSPYEDLRGIHFEEHTVVLRKGSREYAVGHVLVGGGAVSVAVGLNKTYMAVHCK
jgi:hypothetical protein